MTGLELIGAAVLSSIGLAGLGGTIGALVVGTITVAAVGAAVGGITAAITGNDIGTGMLIGAVGGIAVGGLFGSSIVGAMLPTYTPSMGAATSVGGSVATGELVSTASGLAMATPTAGYAGAAGAAGGVASGAGGMGLGEYMLGSAALQGAAALLTPEVETPYSQSQEYLDKVHDDNLDLAYAQIDAQKEAAGGGEDPWNTTKEAYQLQADTEKELLATQGEQKIEQIDKTYELESEENQLAYERSRLPYEQAAGAAGTQGFEGADAAVKAGIIKKQEVATV